MKDFSNLFSEKIFQDEKFLRALNIVKQNSSGNIWLIGSSVYKPIISYLYGIQCFPKDFDFIVEKINAKIIIPDNCKIARNHFGDNKIISDDFQIDVIPLSNLYKSIYESAEPKIENFFEGTPFNIHNLIYDINNKKLIGEEGLKAIREKTVKIYNKKMAQIYAERYNTTVERLIKKKADEIGFTYSLV